MTEDRFVVSTFDRSGWGGVCVSVSHTSNLKVREVRHYFTGWYGGEDDPTTGPSGSSIDPTGRSDPPLLEYRKEYYSPTTRTQRWRVDNHCSTGGREG